MTDLAIFEQQRLALAFGDYLRVQGIACTVELRERVGRGPGHAVVLADGADVVRAQAELEAFAKNPGDPKYLAASWQAGVLPAQLLPVDRGPGLGATLLAQLKSVGPVTLGGIVLCLLVFAAFCVDPDSVFGALAFPPGLSVAAINGEWWRLLTPALIHFNTLHIVGNLLWWWNLGSLVERTQSGLQLLALTLLTALITNVVQFEAYGNQFGGLSAVVYGLLGYLWLYPKANPAVGFQLNRVVVGLMVGYLLIGYTGALDWMAGGKVSNNGHLAGFVVGCVLGLVFGVVNRGKPAKALP